MEARIKALERLKRQKVEANRLNQEEVKKEQERDRLPGNWKKRKDQLDWEKDEDERRKQAEAQGLDYARIKRLKASLKESGRDTLATTNNPKAAANAHVVFGIDVEKSHADVALDVRLSAYRAYDKRVAELPNTRKESQEEPMAYGISDTNDDRMLYDRLGRAAEEDKTRLAELTALAAAKRSKNSRRRTFMEDADIDYINSRNMHFNKKAERFYGKVTREIKESLERGTAV